MIFLKNLMWKFHSLQKNFMKFYISMCIMHGINLWRVGCALVIRRGDVLAQPVVQLLTEHDIPRSALHHRRHAVCSSSVGGTTCLSSCQTSRLSMHLQLLCMGVRADFSKVGGCGTSQLCLKKKIWSLAHAAHFKGLYLLTYLLTYFKYFDSARKNSSFTFTK